MSKKGILRTFHDYFHRLGACNTKLTIEIQKKWTIWWKFLMYLSNIGCHVIYHPTKCELKTTMTKSLGEIVG